MQLPEEIQWKVMRYLRTPTAELINDEIEKWFIHKNKCVRHCISETGGDVEKVTSVMNFLNERLPFDRFVLQGSRVYAWVSDSEYEDESDNDSDSDDRLDRNFEELSDMYENFLSIHL